MAYYNICCSAVWRRVNEEEKFKYLETRNLNQDAPHNTLGAIYLHCRSNNNPSVGQSVDALKTVIISGLALEVFLTQTLRIIIIIIIIIIYLVFQRSTRVDIELVIT
jgi:hypothetical protein